MYTYKLGGMLITDELYHDDLEAVTFGRKDQNELMHYGIKGQSWGKRRFQNEDGSLTMAGRNRYDVGAPLIGTTAANMFKNFTYKASNGSSNGYGGAGGGGGSITTKGSPTMRTYGSGITNGGKSYSYESHRSPGQSAGRTITNKVKAKVNSTVDSGRKAADNLFGRIGNWASNAAKDVGNAATSAYNDASKFVNQAGQDISRTAGNVGNTVSGAFNDAKNWVGDRAQDVGRVATSAYNDASKAIGNAAQDVGNFVKNAPQNISGWYTGDKAGREAQRYDNVVQNFERNGDRNINEGVNKIGDSIDKDIDRIDIDLHGNKGDSSAYYAKNRDDLHDMSNKQFREGLNQRDMGYRQNDIAREYGQKADEAQARYDAAPRQLLNAAGNWIGDRVSDAGNTVGNVLKPGINAVGNAVRDAGNWVGDTTKNIYDDVDYRLYSLGQDIAQPAQNRAWQDFQDRIAQDRETYNREFPGGDYQTWKSASNRIDDAFKDYQRESNKIEQNPISSAVNNVGRSIDEGVQKAGNWAGNAAKDVGNWAGNAAKDVGNWAGQAANDAKNWVGDRAQDVGNAVGSAAKDVGNAVNGAAKDVANWGAGAVESGKNFFSNLFGGGSKETEQPTLSDPNERITEQRIPEAIIREGEKYRQMTPDQRQAHMDSQKNRPTVSGSNNVQTWDNGNINTWDNVKTFGDPDMVNTIKMLNDNGFFNRGSSSNSGNSSSMSDKPSNVSDEFWRDYTFNGGTREQYDAEMQRMRNQNANRQQSSNDMSDKPSNVSDEFWRDYTFNGGTRDSYDREMNARKNSQNNQNGSASRKEVVGTVDTSRPYHFTYDPASGQTIVVYDDEKRR